MLIYGRKVNSDYFTTLDIVSGTQACSNFRPGFALKIYRSYCKEGDTILDTSTGYGGRLVGFMAVNLKGKYIGIDPNTKTHNGNLRMVSELGFLDNVELYNIPVEDIPINILKNRCDFAFTSPPYFTKEIYSNEETQSCIRYPTIEKWINGFLEPMIIVQYEALKNNCLSLINIQDVKIKGKLYQLINYTIEIAKKIGFSLEDIKEYPLQRRMGKGHAKDNIATEKVLVFKKIL